MNCIDYITRFTDLENNESLSTFNGFTAQQTHLAYQVFWDFLEKERPVKILEIGTALGGFTEFLRYACDELSIECKILSYDISARPWYESLRNKNIDIRVENIFNSDFTDLNKEVLEFISSEGKTVVLCDGGNKIKEFNLLSKFIKTNDFILAHDYAENKTVFDEKIKNKVWNWHEIQESDILESCKKYELEYYDKDSFESAVWTCRIKKGKSNSKKVTLVTGLWDIGRGELGEGWSRSYETYLDKFSNLLNVKENLIVFGDEKLKSFVFSKRSPENTLFVEKPLDWFKKNEFYENIQSIRNNKEWNQLAGWLAESTQAKLEMYNPLVMSKMFLLHDAKILDPFNSDFLFWIDAGLSNTVHPGYFTHDKVLEKITKYIDKFSFVCFPYKASNEIHGFEYTKMNSYAGSKVKKVARGGFFGGPKNTISEINGIYYNLLSSSLSEGLMGTEESIFSIMVYKNAEIINYFEIEENGLLSKFFEDLKNETLVVKSEVKSENNFNINKTSLYVITFNSPSQFRTLLESMEKYDKNFLEKPKKILLNNSTLEETFDEYNDLCKKYDFEHIKKDNLGICGGRQFIAEHFEQSGQDYMFFFEDDMFFYLGANQVCKNGFNRIVDNLYNKSLEIIKKENFDFLKLNYTEFFGDNGTQWSWYNVPQNKRDEYWPEKNKLPEIGLDPNAPKTVYNKIVSHKGVPYASGEVYYCNWPQIVSKDGNIKMFIDTKWAHPYEQTWMSHIYQLTKSGDINSGLLLMTPTEHNRFEHYSKDLRKES